MYYIILDLNTREVQLKKTSLLDEITSRQVPHQMVYHTI